MNKVEVKHKWDCPKCGERINIREMVNRENTLMYVKLALIVSLSIALGISLTFMFLSIMALVN